MRESASAPVTSVDSHTITTQRGSEKQIQKGGAANSIRGYKCTCHVCGQTHKYDNPKPQRQLKEDTTGQQREDHRKKEYECTCHVCGQTHKYNQLDEKWGEYECTCHVCGQTHKYKERDEWWKFSGPQSTAKIKR